MSMFADVDRQGATADEDRVVSGNRILDTDYYEGQIKLAFGGIATSGAKSVTLHIDVNGVEVRETVYVTSKSGGSTYPDRDNPSIKRDIPGLILINDLCMLSTNKALKEQTIAEKTVKLYNYTTKKDEPTVVPMLVDLLGKTARFCITRQIVDKQAKDSEGNYANTGQTREENTLAKFLWEDGRTVSEVQGGVTTPVFKETWLAANKGKTRNRAKGVEGTAGQPGGASGMAKPLFGNPAAASAPKPSGLFGQPS